MHVDVGNAESAALDRRSAAILFDDDAALLLEDGRLVFVPAETGGRRVARHFAPQFDAFARLAGRVAQRLQHPQSAYYENNRQTDEVNHEAVCSFV